MDVCIENIFPAVAMPFNPFQKGPRENRSRKDQSREDKRRKPDTLESRAIPDTTAVDVDALFVSVKAGTDEPELLNELIEYLSERIGTALIASGQRARTIGVQIRYMDQFSARQTMRLTRPSNDERELLAEARELFASLFKRRGPVQMLGLSATNLEPCLRQEELRGGEFATAGAAPFEAPFVPQGKQGRHAPPLWVAARVGLR